jgi:RHS repeat-associated protein
VDYVQWTGSSSGGSTATYKYDPSGRRIEKDVDGDTTTYVYDGGNVIAEYDDNGDLASKYIHGARVDELVCMIDVADSNAVYYYHYDGLGSVVALSNSSGTSIQSYEYSAYGQVAASDPNFTANPYLFTGRRFDYETGLYYYRARYYNPYIGRFVQTDPIGYGDGINWYAYCGNNPLNFIDPSGLAWEDPAVRIIFYNGDDPDDDEVLANAADDPFWDIRINIGKDATKEAGYGFAVDYMIDMFDDLRKIIYEAIPVNIHGQKIFDIDTQITIEGVWFLDHSGGFGGESVRAGSDRFKVMFNRLKDGLDENNGAGAKIHLRTCHAAGYGAAKSYITAIAELTGHAVTGGNDFVTIPSLIGSLYHGLWDPPYYNSGGYSIAYPKFNDSGGIIGSWVTSYTGYETSVFRDFEVVGVDFTGTVTYLMPVRQNATHVY